MASGLVAAHRTRCGHDRKGWVFVGGVGVLVAAFLVAPGTLSDKAHLALHGLCAQTPSHSYLLGGQRLPFDARMTGIYGGALAAAVYLLVRGRFRAWRPPPFRVLVLLALSVLAMAIDGTNSLARDVGLATPYLPSNSLRLVTGLLTGVALAVALCYLVGTTFWRTGNPATAPVSGLPEWLVLALLQLPVGLAVVSGAGVLFLPVALALVVSALATVAVMLLTSALLVSGRDRSFVAFADLAIPATASLFAAAAVVAGLAVGRFALEAAIGAPPLR